MSQWVLYTGSHNINTVAPFERNFTIKSVMMHEGYNAASLENDIALVITDKDIEYNDHTSPICLPNNGHQYTAGQMCYLAGWGNTGSMYLLFVSHDTFVNTWTHTVFSTPYACYTCPTFWNKSFWKISLNLTDCTHIWDQPYLNMVQHTSVQQMLNVKKDCIIRCIPYIQHLTYIFVFKFRQTWPPPINYKKKPHCFRHCWRGAVPGESSSDGWQRLSTALRGLHCWHRTVCWLWERWEGLLWGKWFFLCIFALTVMLKV